MKKSYWITGAILLIALICGSFYDLPISQALYNEHNAFGILFAGLGETGYFLCSGAGITLAYTGYDAEKKKTCIPLCILATVSFLFGAGTAMYQAYEYFSGWLLILIPILEWCVFAFMVHQLRKFAKDVDKRKLRIVALALALQPILSFVIINIAKLIWARPRYRSIAGAANLPYQNWWEIGTGAKAKYTALGVAGEEFKSFPSGHTGNASTTLAISLTSLVLPQLKDKRKLLYWCAAVFAFLVAFSRIIMGAHFLTDVTMGFTTTFIIFLVLSTRTEKKLLTADDFQETATASAAQ